MAAPTPSGVRPPAGRDSLEGRSFEGPAGEAAPDVHAGLAALARGEAPLRRALARLAARFVALRGWERLGYVRLRDWAVERLGLSARTLRDLARMEAAFAELPGLERAFVRGELSWAKARLVARVATAADEGRWLELARGLRVRALEREVRAVDVGSLEAGAGAEGAETDEEGAPIEEREGIAIVCAPHVRAKWFRARELARSRAGGKCVRGPAGVRGNASGTRVRSPASSGARSGCKWVLRAARCRGQTGGKRVHGTGFGRKRARGRAASCENAGGKCGRRTARSHGRAGGKCVRGRAGSRGRAGGRGVRGRVASRGRAGSQRVRGRGGSRGSSDGKCVRAPAGSSGTGLAPLNDAAAAATPSPPGRQTGAQATLSGAEKSAADADPEPASEETARLFWSAPKPAARFFRATLCSVRRQIERTTGWLPTASEGFEAMLDHALDAWSLADGPLRREHRVFERDGWRCAVPGCTSYRNLHDHHVEFRSAGGSDAESNRITLCAGHHLRGVHAGRVRIRGKAPGALRFELGLRPGAPPLEVYRSGDVRP
jgi:hypothetical protein